MIYDCVIIGAGASGLYCASRILSQKDLSVAVIDLGNRPGKKLLMTGGGRCNLSNRSIDISKYYTDNPTILKEILASHGSEDALRFFTDVLGLAVSYDGDLVYPSSYRASTVLDSIVCYLKEHNCSFIFDTAITSVLLSDGIYDLGNDIKARTVVLAAGGASYPETGSNGSFINILKSFQDVKITPLLPSLVPLKTAERDIFTLSGKRVKCHLDLYQNRKRTDILSSSDGELLFTDYGVSGICVLDISGFAVRAIKNGQRPVLVVKLCDPEKVRYNLSIFPERCISDALIGVLQKDLIDVLLKRTGIDCTRTVSTLSDKEVEIVASGISEMMLSITGSRSYDQAQVTTGGVDLSSLDRNLSVPGHNNFFVCGESLNVDGICGGYNLQFAWSSADLASKGVIGCLS